MVLKVFGQNFKTKKKCVLGIAIGVLSVLSVAFAQKQNRDLIYCSIALSRRKKLIYYISCIKMKRSKTLNYNTR